MDSEHPHHARFALATNLANAIFGSYGLRLSLAGATYVYTPFGSIDIDVFFQLFGWLVFYFFSSIIFMILVIKVRPAAGRWRRSKVVLVAGPPRDVGYEGTPDTRVRVLVVDMFEDKRLGVTTLMGRITYSDVRLEARAKREKKFEPYVWPLPMKYLVTEFKGSFCTERDTSLRRGYHHHVTSEALILKGVPWEVTTTVQIRPFLDPMAKLKRSAKRVFLGMVVGGGSGWFLWWLAFDVLRLWAVSLVGLWLPQFFAIGLGLLIGPVGVGWQYIGWRYRVYDRNNPYFSKEPGFISNILMPPFPSGEEIELKVGVKLRKPTEEPKPKRDTDPRDARLGRKQRRKLRAMLELVRKHQVRKAENESKALQLREKAERLTNESAESRELARELAEGAEKLRGEAAELSKAETKILQEQAKEEDKRAEEPRKRAKELEKEVTKLLEGAASFDAQVSQENEKILLKNREIDKLRQEATELSNKERAQLRLDKETVDRDGIRLKKLEEELEKLTKKADGLKNAGQDAVAEMGEVAELQKRVAALRLGIKQTNERIKTLEAEYTPQAPEEDTSIKWIGADEWEWLLEEQRHGRVIIDDVYRHRPGDGKNFPVVGRIPESGVVWHRTRPGSYRRLLMHQSKLMAANDELRKENENLVERLSSVEARTSSTYLRKYDTVLAGIKRQLTEGLQALDARYGLDATHTDKFRGALEDISAKLTEIEEDFGDFRREAGLKKRKKSKKEEKTKTEEKEVRGERSPLLIAQR